MHVHCIQAVLAGVIVFCLCLAAAKRFDRENLGTVERKEICFWLGLSAVNSLYAEILCEARNVGIPCGLWLGVVAGGLLFACFTDLRCRQVYDYTWWIIMTAGASLLYRTLSLHPSVLWQLLIFLLLQRFLFDRFYGRADVYAFCVCALTEGSLDMGLKWYLLHMGTALLLLAVVQGIRRNIGRDGNLKTAVPFLPYIVVSFWGSIFLFLCS